MTQMKTERPSPALERCIKECMECYQECVRTESYCLEMGGKHASPVHLNLLRDCAQMCRLSADMMLRGSERHELACALCADFLRACAEECERLGAADSRMKACAAACRRCADTCEKLSS